MAPRRDRVRDDSALAAKRVRRCIRSASRPKMLDQLRRTLGRIQSVGLYQQAPSPQRGGMIKMVWFKSYAANERREKFDGVVQS